MNYLGSNDGRQVEEFTQSLRDKLMELRSGDCELLKQMRGGTVLGRLLDIFVNGLKAVETPNETNWNPKEWVIRGSVTIPHSYLLGRLENKPRCAAVIIDSAFQENLAAVDFDATTCVLVERYFLMKGFHFTFSRHQDLLMPYSEESGSGFQQYHSLNLYYQSWPVRDSVRAAYPLLVFLNL